MDDVVSDFFENVCQLREQPNTRKLIVWKRTAYDLRLTAIGNCCDVYIEPIAPGSKIIDMMLFNQNFLAVPSEDDTPRRLPLPFADTVSVSVIVDTEFACHVKLLVVGQLRKKLEGREFTLSPVPPNSRLHLHGSICEMTAMSQVGDSGLAGGLSTDSGFTIFTVSSVRCLVWPTQAGEWATRRRDHGWPDNATLERVVSGGCDLVNASPRACRHSKIMEDEFMWRFSFSRAETDLLNSWTTRQQTVYEIFRFVVKKCEALSLKDESGRKMLKSYHLKTLMMWNCELHDSCWWIRSNIVQRVAFLMRFLLNCCKKSFCQGYFVSKANLFEGCTSGSLANRIRMFTGVTELNEWLVNNCIRPQVEQCSDNIIRLFDDIGTTAALRSAMSALEEWKLQNLLLESFDAMKSVLWFICCTFCNGPAIFNRALIRKWQTQLADVDERLVPAYLTPLLCLSILRTISSSAKHVNSHTADILTAALTICDESDMATPMSTESTGSIMLRKAVHLLQRCVYANSDTRRSLLLELSYSYLHLAQKHLDNTDNQSHMMIDCYSAVLYHVIGQHKKVTGRCQRVIRSSPCGIWPRDTYVIEGRCLPQVSHEVDVARGLALLYQCIRRTQLESHRHSPQPAHVDVFTVGLFAHHLMLSSRAAKTDYDAKPVRALIRRYRKSFLRVPHAFITDLLLFMASAHKKKTSLQDERKSNSSSHFTRGNLHQLTVTYSVEQLTKLLEVLSRDFGSQFSVAKNEYAAMDAYCCGMYEECMQLNDQEFGSLWNADHHFRTPLFGCMTYLMDDDMASISALRVLMPGDCFNGDVHQVTVSLYLTLASSLELELPIKKIMGIMKVVRILYNRHPTGNVFDRLLLSFIYRKAITTALNPRMLDN